MEFPDVINTQYAFHGIIVGCVLAFAVLVFVFGFKSAEEPPFDKLTNAHEDRKAAGKKKKLKDKKNQSNGHATSVTDGTGSAGASGGSKRSGETKSPKKDNVDKSPIKEQKKQEKKSPAKSALKETKQNKVEKNATSGSNADRKARGKENVEVKVKKNKVIDEKPKDFDDGEWEQALSKRDKKNRKSTLEEILPQKNLGADKKKDNKEKKKIKEDLEIKLEITPEIIEEVVNIKEKTPAEKSEPVMDTSSEPIVDDTKPPKKAKKKKQNSESSSNGITEEKPTVIEEVAPPPKAQRQKKVVAPETSAFIQEEIASSVPVSEPAKVEVSNPVSESNVVFDELGDTWKEAKAPKKNQKKKSRKD